MIEENKILTDREIEVLYYMTKSLTNREIAAILDITHHTVKAHISAILRKLECKNRTEVALYAVQHNLFDNLFTHRPDLEQP